MNCDNCKDSTREAKFNVVMYKEGSTQIDVVVPMCAACKEAFEWGEARAQDGAMSQAWPIENG